MRPAPLIAVVVAAGVTLTACKPAPSPSTEHAVSEAQIARARGDLAELPTAGEPHTAGYDRDEFGPAWADVDRNGCDTRNDILLRDLSGTRRKDNCVVTSGVLHDPYTGRTVRFRRGPDSSDVQIDHLYPLHRAWIYGAWQWIQRDRVSFANDANNLIAVSGTANTSKSDSGPAEWQPPRRDYRCAYAVRYVNIARIYDLPVTAKDRQALTRALAGCHPTKQWM